MRFNVAICEDSEVQSKIENLGRNFRENNSKKQTGKTPEFVEG
jgi:hypothetical protein